MPIEFPCPECERKLRVKDELAGRRVKCPGCSASITIPDADAQPPAPKKAAVKPGKPAPAPARRPRDEEDEDEAPRRPARGRADDEDEERPRKKPRPRDDDEDDEPRKKGGKKAGGSSMPLVLGIGGGVLALLLVGGGIWWMMSGQAGPGGPVAGKDAGKDGVKDGAKGGPPSGTEKLAEWAPGDALTVTSIRVADIHASAHGKKLLAAITSREPKLDLEAELQKYTGFKFQDIERVTLVVENGEVGWGWAVIETTAPYTQASVRSKFRSPSDQTFKGKSYIRGEFAGFHPGAPPMCAHFATDRMLVVGPEEAIQLAINAGAPRKAGPQDDAVALIGKGRHAVLGVAVTPLLKLQMGHMTREKPFDEYVPLTSVTSGHLGVTVAEKIDTEVTARYPNDAEAARAKPAADKGLKALLGLVTAVKLKGGAMGSTEMEMFLALYDLLVEGMTAEQQGPALVGKARNDFDPAPLVSLAFSPGGILWGFTTPPKMDWPKDVRPKDGPYKDGPPKDGGKPTQPAIRLTAEAYAQEWAKDEAAAGAKYKGRTVELSGTVAVMHADALGLAVLTFVVPPGSKEIRCAMNDKASWLRASKGSKVTVRGTAYDGGLDPCVFVEVGPNPAITITSEALAAELVKDREATLARYKDKTLNLTGQITAKTKDADGHVKVELKGAGGLTVICWFPAFMAREAEPLKVGQTITVVDDFASSFLKDKEMAFHGFRVLAGGAAPKDGPPKDGPPKDIPPKILPDEPTGIATERMKAILKAQLDCQKKFGGLANDILDPSGKPLLSWRVTLLQFMGPDEVALFKQFSLRQPWNSPHNLKLMERMPSVYAPPGGAGTKTPYMVFRSANTAFPDFKASLKPADFKDGAGRTILLTESTVPRDWTQPIDLTFTAERNPISFCKPRGRCILLGMADGNVLRIPERVSQKSFLAALTPAAGDAIGPDFAPE